MYKLPLDIEKDLQEKYPDTPVEMFVQDLFQAILRKSLLDGSCTVRSFGKFISYVCFSGIHYRKIVRFKFRISLALSNKIKMDEYLLENLPVQSQVNFGESNKEKCGGESRKIKLENEKLVYQSCKYENESNRQYQATQLVKDLVYSDDNENFGVN